MSLLLQAIPTWLELVSLACCFGVLVMSLYVVPRTGEGENGQEKLLAGMWPLLGISVAVLFASSILGLLMSAAEMSGYPITGVLSVLPTVLLRTHLGHTWIVRAVTIAALAVALSARGSRPARYVMLSCALVVSAMDTASGHASDAGDLSLAEFMDWLHLVAAMVWGGGLLVLSWRILPRLLKDGDRAARSMAGLATWFSRIAGVAVGIIAVTAAYQAWAHAGGLGEIAYSPYGRILIAKVVLFGLLIVLGGFNRYVSVRRLHGWAHSATGKSDALRFARAVKLEALLVIAVLLCAALLRHEEPARHSVHRTHRMAAWAAPLGAPRAPSHAPAAPSGYARPQLVGIMGPRWPLVGRRERPRCPRMSSRRSIERTKTGIRFPAPPLPSSRISGAFLHP